MRIPKESTIRRNFRVYAYKAGFTILPQANGLYNVFDNRMGYTTHTNRNMTEVVRIIIDEMHMIEYNRKNRSANAVAEDSSWNLKKQKNISYFDR